MSTNTAAARNNKKNSTAARTESEPAAAGPTPAAPATVESATGATPAAHVEPSAAAPVETTPAAPTETAIKETDEQREARESAERTERARAETAAHLAAGDASASGAAAAIAAHAGARGAVIDATPAGELITAILKRDNGAALIVRAALERVPFRTMQSALSDAGADVRERIGAALTGAALLDLFPSDDVTGALIASVNPFRRARPTEYSMEAAADLLREGYALADLTGEDARGISPITKSAIKIVKNAAAAAGDLRTFAVKGAETGHKGFPPAALMFCAALDSLALMSDSDTSKSLAARRALAKAGAGTMVKGAKDDSARREGARAAARDAQKK
jgi:hypothetical protein